MLCVTENGNCAGPMCGGDANVPRMCDTYGCGYYGATQTDGYIFYFINFVSICILKYLWAGTTV